MNLKQIFLAASLLGSLSVFAQKQSSTAPVQPFMFLVNTVNNEQAPLTLNYSGSLAQRTEGPFGYDGFNQQLAGSAYLGRRLTFLGNISLGFSSHGSTQTAQQAEVIKNFIGGKKSKGLALGFGVGLNRDWDNVKAAMGRVTLGYTASAFRLSGNMLFQKAFSGSRDKIDFTTGLGFQHRIQRDFFAGVEMLGEDLEGFWEKDEAEGGAKMLIGPSLNYKPAQSRFSFSASGGPVFFATKSSAFSSGALRDIGRSAQNGYSIRAGMSFNLK